MLKNIFLRKSKKKKAFYLYKYFLLSVITILDLDKYTKHKNKYNLKIEEKSVVVIFIPFFYLINCIDVTVLIYIFSFIKIQFSYGRTHYFKTIKNYTVVYLSI